MYQIAAFYSFTPLASPEAARAQLLPLCSQAGLCGTAILAHEGINGTLAGPKAGIDALKTAVGAIAAGHRLEWKESQASHKPFRRLKIRIKPEIVTLGLPTLDPTAPTGTYVSARDWNRLIADPETVLIDTRNAYETAIGTFEGAIDPGTDSFRDFPTWWRGAREGFRDRPVAMFCTGGIRCEKATRHLLANGAKDVFHLEGGILRYLEEVPAADSQWRGACFVFDERVSVGHGLTQGPHRLCHGCRRPVAPEAKAHPAYEAGVSCPACIGEKGEDRRARSRERQRQIALARARGISHRA